VLVFQEIKFCCPIHGRSRVCCSQKLLCTTSLDTTNSKGLWYTLNHVPLLCDNKSAIQIAYNPCEYSRTKHIDIRYHFLRDHAIKGDIVISHLRANEQHTDIFTNPLDKKRFRELRSQLNIIDSRNVV
jgi:hypothetical protein